MFLLHPTINTHTIIIIMVHSEGEDQQSTVELPMLQRMQTDLLLKLKRAVLVVEVVAWALQVVLEEVQVLTVSEPAAPDRTSKAVPALLN
jgi:hypothetical protein